MAISSRLRYEILRRDEFTCRYCGATPPDATLTVDHVVPVALGGTDESSNLTAACRDCNSGKTSTAPDHPVVQDVSEDALRWAKAMRQAAAQQAQLASRHDEQLVAFEETWNRWTYNGGAHVSRPGNWVATVRNWLDAGVEIQTLCDLINDVLPRNVTDDMMWRYFCGAVRKVLEKRQEMAQEILADDVHNTIRLMAQSRPLPEALRFARTELERLAA